LCWLAERPGIVRRLPFELRDWFTRRCLKAGAAGWLKPRFGKVRCNPGRTVVAARGDGKRIILELDDGARSFDHVVLGTGYHVDLSHIGILGPQLLAAIACVDGSPLLRSGFESSVAKLHFVGSSAVKSFGPLMRFVAGAPYAARAITSAALTRRPRRAVADFPAPAAPAAGTPGRAAANVSPPR